MTDIWLDGHFELVELAILGSQQRRGIGGRLNDLLIEGSPHSRALLETWTWDSPARRLCLRRGWEVLTDLDEQTIMGLELAPG